MVSVGTVAGGVLGYMIGDHGFGQAGGVFLGMSLAGLLLALAATTFTMAPFRPRVFSGAEPLIVGAGAWIAYSLWSSPVALALGIIVGSLARILLARLLLPTFRGASRRG